MNNELWFNKPPGGGGYQIERSLRFNSAESAYLSRTPASAGNRKTWTWAGWVKKSQIAPGGDFFFVSGSSTPGEYFICNWYDAGMAVTDFSFYYFRMSDVGQYLRDPSAWYHIVIVLDSTAATASNRIRVYVNGELLSSPSYYPTGITLNQEFGVNRASLHQIGRFNGYLADVHFCDGYAYDPSYFTEFDDNGILQPIAFTGSYGTNGFHLPFSDNSTAAALGTDTSGNGNTWTVNNLSVAAGAGNDSLVDTPTNYGEDTGVGGEVRGNYCTLNPVVGGASSTQITFANGNLEATWNTTAGYAVVLGTIGVSTGKWYWETTIANTSALFGVATGSSSLTQYIGGEASSYGYYNVTGNTYNNGTTVPYGDTYTTGDVIGIALDLDNGKLYFSKNGTWQNSGSPTGGTGEAYSGLTGTFFPAYAEGNSTDPTSYGINFGQRPFVYTAPSGFKALCTANLPSTTITTSGSYTGNGSTDGPFVYLNGVPTAMTVNGNAVTFGTDADKLSNGFKIRTANTTFNLNASTYNYSITSTGDPFKTARAQSNS